MSLLYMHVFSGSIFPYLMMLYGLGNVAELLGEGMLPCQWSPEVVQVNVPTVTWGGLGCLANSHQGQNFYGSEPGMADVL